MPTNNAKIRLALCSRQSRIDETKNGYAEPNRSAVVPALLSSLVRLELALCQDPLDLADLVSIVKNDVGLTVQLLRFAAREIEGCAKKTMPISDLIVLAGRDRLVRLVQETESVSGYLLEPSQLVAYQRFLMHAKLSGLVAEELASETADIGREEAFLVGVLYHLSDLPLLLDWGVTALETRDLREVVGNIAKDWNLPDALVDVIRGVRSECTSESAVLLDLASVASTWAYRLESLAARESGTTSATDGSTQ